MIFWGANIRNYAVSPKKFWNKVRVPSRRAACMCAVAILPHVAHADSKTAKGRNKAENVESLKVLKFDAEFKNHALYSRKFRPSKFKHCIYGIAIIPT